MATRDKGRYFGGGRYSSPSATRGITISKLSRGSEDCSICLQAKHPDPCMFSERTIKDMITYLQELLGDAPTAVHDDYEQLIKAYKD